MREPLADRLLLLYPSSKPGKDWVLKDGRIVQWNLLSPRPTGKQLRDADYEIKRERAIPSWTISEFWGLFTLEDKQRYRKARSFSEALQAADDDLKILPSGHLLKASSIAVTSILDLCVGLGVFSGRRKEQILERSQV